MSTRVIQTIYASGISLIFVLAIHRLGRKQKLSFRYAVGWLVLGVLGLVGGILAPLSEPLANQLQLSPAALLAIGGMILLLILCVQLSISISGLQEQVRTLAEEVANVREELDQVKRNDRQV